MNIGVAIFIIAMHIIAKLVVLGSFLMVGSRGRVVGWSWGMVDSMVNGSMVDSMVADMMDTMDKLSLFSVCGGDCSDKGEKDSQDSECLKIGNRS